MPLKPQSLLSSKTNAQTPRLTPRQNGGTQRIRLAASAGVELLPLGTPIAFNNSTDFWVPWTQPSDAAVYTITSDGIPATAGTFVLMVDGLSMVAVFDVTAAALETELQALLADAGKDYSATAAPTTGTDLGDASAVITITFDEAAGAPSVDLDLSGLTGAAPESTLSRASASSLP